MSKRVFLIVLDSFGIGEANDSKTFGDEGSNTLRSVSTSEYFNADTLNKLGLSSIDSVDYLTKEEKILGAYCRLSELSAGKDTTIGHWEIGGVISDVPLPTFPDGFPDEIIDEFSRLTGREVLCNKPYSGTKVINDYGKQHIESGALIVYTSADSVFQIAAHEDVVPVEDLYKYCKIARKILTGKYGVGRVIARPFTGDVGNFQRTSNRHDFSIDPPSKTMLDYLKDAGYSTICIGKITDIFNYKGVTESVYTKSNLDGMNKSRLYIDKDFEGLCFINLVDFDMTYGHRRDIDGYAKAIAEFDNWLDSVLCDFKDDDILMITADHGCDPGFTKTTDHTREYVPLLVYGKSIKPVNLGTRNGFCDIAKTICEYLSVQNDLAGNSFLGEVYG